MLKNGNKMAPEQFAEYIVPQNGMLVRVRMSDGRFAAVYEYQETLGLYRPSKMFLEDRQSVMKYIKDTLVLK